MPVVVIDVDEPHDRRDETMSGPVALRLGDRTIWLVPPASVVPAFSRTASDVLGGAIAAWPGAFALRDLSDAAFGPFDDVTDAHRFAAAEVEAERWLVVRLGDGARGRPITQGDGAVRWDDLPRLSDLRPTIVPDRPRGGGSGGRTTPTSPIDDGPQDDTRRDDPATTFVAFAVVDQHGVPLSGVWSCADDRGPLRGQTVRVSGLPRDAASVELTLGTLRRTAAGR